MTPEEALGIRQSAKEETLQSIDDTLKRIEIILLQLQNQSFVSAVPIPLEQKSVKSSTD